MKSGAALLAVLAWLSGCAKRLGEGVDAPVVVVAKRVHTLDPANPVAQALALHQGRLLYVGTEAGALAAAGAGAHVERFPDATVVPGLVDAHGHLTGLGEALSQADLSRARSEAEAVAEVLRRADSTQGDWRLGRGWDQNDWPGKAFPTKASLDAALPGLPVVLSRVDGHAVWVSSAALQRAGVTKATVDPPGGRILRDERGEPTGVLVDAATALVDRLVPKPTPDELRRQLKLALERCAQLGLTGVHEAGMALPTFELLQTWDAQDLLPIRVYAMADAWGGDGEDFLGRGTFKGRKLQMRAVKLGADGALGSRGAALVEPYSDEPSTRGLPLLSKDALLAKASAFAERGFQVCVHAIGDQANADVLDVLSQLEQAHPGSRHRVEHAQVLRAQDVGRFAASGVIASMQPTHATSDMPWAQARLGPERLKGAYAWRTLLDAKARLALGSDFPVESPNPLFGLYAARTRQDHAGQPVGGWRPEERLTGREALEGFTTGAAWASFAEAERGQLKAGFDADFVVLPVDPVDDEPTALLDAQVLVTFVGGVDVYRARSR